MDFGTENQAHRQMDAKTSSHEDTLVLWAKQLRRLRHFLRNTLTLGLPSHITDSRTRHLPDAISGPTKWKAHQ